MNRICFKVPSKDDLKYRQKWMMDPDTMSYNAGYDVDIKGYDKETGIISKTDEEMLEWYDKWINKEPDRYFRYIYTDGIEEPIGEIYYYPNNNTHHTGILIQSKYRGNGYAYNALKELERIAFEENGIELTATTGKAACKILVDKTFSVVRERKNIADENQVFTNYVQGKFVDDFWWK